MFSATNMAITSRFLGFVREVIEFSPISRTLRVLVLSAAHPGAPSAGEFAAVFFAPGVAGVAIALWAANRPSGAAISTTLLRALSDSSSEQIHPLTSTEKIHDALIVLRSALEAQLRGTPEHALILTSAFDGAAVELAATVTASTGMPPNGNLALCDYLATFSPEAAAVAVSS